VLAGLASHAASYFDLRHNDTDTPLMTGGCALPPAPARAPLGRSSESGGVYLSKLLWPAVR
jgi:hypothetical protein